MACPSNDFQKWLPLLSIELAHIDVVLMSFSLEHYRLDLLEVSSSETISEQDPNKCYPEISVSVCQRDIQTLTASLSYHCVFQSPDPYYGIIGMLVLHPLYILLSASKSAAVVTTFLL